MFQAVLTCGKRGWSPILPQWQTIYGYQYNRSWVDPCVGPYAYYGENRRSLNNMESKLLATPAIAGYTLHVPGNSNGFRYEVPPEWEQVYLAMMKEVSVTPTPTQDYEQRQELLRLAAKSVPTMIIDTEGNVALYEVGGKITNRTEAHVTARRLGILPRKEKPYPPLPPRLVPLTDAELTATMGRLVEGVTTLGQNLREQVEVELHG